MDKAVTFKNGETLETLKGLKVFVYFNLTKKVFSIKALEGRNKGRVVAHTEQVRLHGGVEFKVSQAGRIRTVSERKKYVHAGVVGKLLGFKQVTLPEPQEQLLKHDWKVAYYNPYKTETFTSEGKPLFTAQKAYLVNKQVFFK